MTQLWSVPVALVFLTTSSLLTQPVYYAGKHKHSDIQKTLSPQETKCTFIKSTCIATKQRAFWAAPDAWTCLLSCKRCSPRGWHRLVAVLLAGNLTSYTGSFLIIRSPISQDHSIPRGDHSIPRGYHSLRARKTREQEDLIER